MTNQNSKKTYRYGTQIGDCYDRCPYVMRRDYVRCDHPKIGHRFVAEHADYKGFPEWCPLPDVDQGGGKGKPARRR